MSDDAQRVGARLQTLLCEAGLDALAPETAERFGEFYLLLARWNARMNLTAVRDEEGILCRHFIESITCARRLPPQIRTLLDFGSGAGFPGIPIAICQPGIAVTLAESQGKKAAFLQEAVRVLELEAQVYAGRAEGLKEDFDCVTLRAVDRMERAVETAAQLVRPGGWLVLLTTSGNLPELKAIAGAAFSWAVAHAFAGHGNRVLTLAQRVVRSPV